jgi:hypothetical protein
MAGLGLKATEMACDIQALVSGQPGSLLAHNAIVHGIQNTVR